MQGKHRDLRMVIHPTPSQVTPQKMFKGPTKHNDKGKSEPSIFDWVTGCWVDESPWSGDWAHENAGCSFLF